MGFPVVPAARTPAWMMDNVKSGLNDQLPDVGQEEGLKRPPPSSGPCLIGNLKDVELSLHYRGWMGRK